MKIALLLPRSVIYPSLSFDIMDGFKESLKTMGLEGRHEIISKGIGVAAKQQEIYEICEQFLLEGADIIIGYINPQIAQFIHSLFEASSKVLLVLDSGYHFPNFKGKLSNAYFISLQGCLCTRVIAQKAIEDGYKKFAFTCSFYDAGYRPSYVFSAAVEEKGGAIVYNHITALRKEDFTVAPLYNFLQETNDTAVLAAFCGDMAEDFFRKNNGITENFPVYGTSFTSEEIWLSKIPYPGNDWNSAVAWAQDIQTSENNVFLETMNKIKEGKANLFSLLGWEAALFIGSENKDFDDLTIASPRGKVWMNPENRFTEAPVYYAQVSEDKKTGNCMLKNVSEATVTETERENLQHNIEYIQSTSANTWLNSYACLES